MRPGPPRDAGSVFSGQRRSYRQQSHVTCSRGVSRCAFVRCFGCVDTRHTINCPSLSIYTFVTNLPSSQEMHSLADWCAVEQKIGNGVKEVTRPGPWQVHHRWCPDRGSREVLQPHEQEVKVSLPSPRCVLACREERAMLSIVTIDSVRKKTVDRLDPVLLHSGNRVW